MRRLETIETDFFTGRWRTRRVALLLGTLSETLCGIGFAVQLARHEHRLAGVVIVAIAGPILAFAGMAWRGRGGRAA